jgi:CBS domain-containing protein
MRGLPCTGELTYLAWPASLPGSAGSASNPPLWPAHLAPPTAHPPTHLPLPGVPPTRPSPAPPRACLQVRPETPALDAMVLMEEKNISAVAVVNAAGCIIGNFSISELRCLHACMHAHPPPPAWVHSWARGCLPLQLCPCACSVCLAMRLSCSQFANRARSACPALCACRTIMAEHFGSLALPVGEFLALEHGTGAPRPLLPPPLLQSGAAGAAGAVASAVGAAAAAAASCCTPLREQHLHQPGPALLCPAHLPPCARPPAHVPAARLQSMPATPFPAAAAAPAPTPPTS